MQRMPLLPEWRYWPAVALAALILLAGYGATLSAPPTNPSYTKTNAVAHQDNPLSDFWNWITKDSISFFTFTLAIVSGGQGLLIWQQMRLGRQEFVATHRPRLRVRSMQTDGLGGATFLTVANVGETTATITGIVGIFRLRNQAGRWLNGRPDSSKEHAPPKEFCVLKTGVRHTFLIPMNQPDPAEIDTINRRQEILVAVGTIRYVDEIGTERRTGFCWSFDPGITEFIDPEKTTEFNYED